MEEDEIEEDLVLEQEETTNADLQIINNSFFLIKDLLELDSDLYDQLNEDKIKAVRQTFDVIASINKKIINDYKKK